MTEIKSPIAILRLLNKSNCGGCNEPTCLAFASKVFKGWKSLNECPHIEQDILKHFNEKANDSELVKEEYEEALEQLKARLKTVDLALAGKKLDTPFKDGKLTVKVCGKDFSVDSKGNFYSAIHVHHWLTLPVLSYIIDGEGIDPSGNWVAFRELKGGKDWDRFFDHRCEKPMQKIADRYPEFFADILHIFGGRKEERHFDSDISLVLYPLPKMPVLICYWRPEDDMKSDFHLFFDDTAANNLSINYIYNLMTGMLVMFEKITLRHN
jgi:hypothetical protein